MDGFYQGTRFDRSGVFGSVSFGGIEFCAPWYERYDPFMHDAVLGPAEEFSPIFLPSCHFDQAKRAEKSVLKIGVGLLRLPDDAPYDRFRLYEIINPGEWSVEQTADSVRFRHVIPGSYIYKKEVRLLSGSSFEISHELSASEEQLDGDVYNHNFFTLGLLSTGPGRCIDLPYQARGDWRAQYDSVALTPQGFRFSRTLQKGESVYMGNIRAASAPAQDRPGPFGHTPYELTISETALPGGASSAQITPTVRVHGSVPVLRSVMWANHRIACIEPYNAFCAIPGHPFRWTIRYDLSV
jgi:hypothetical protein